MLLSNSLCSGRVIVEAKGRMIKKNFKISILIRNLLSCFMYIKDSNVHVTGLWLVTDCILRSALAPDSPPQLLLTASDICQQVGWGTLVLTIFWCATLSQKVAGKLIPSKDYLAATDLMLWSATCFQLLSIWIIRWITSICHIAI